MATLTVEVPDEVVHSLESMAEKSNNSLSVIVGDALTIFLGLPRPER